LIGYDVTGVNVHKDVALKTLRIELNIIANDPIIATIYQLVWVPIVEMCCYGGFHPKRRPSAWRVRARALSREIFFASST
jgi:hypothetical protein